ncbi:MAG TPA: radical SAM family heme chaperone HemW [Bryobacteraceae bacterium]|nr:radical SAM family heme chaperone HemW [Bryobacteraceae bacterium]
MDGVPGVYISYPFCAQKCTYCNFASGVFPREMEPRYIAALRTEMERHEWQWRPETVYLGGGTPSLIDAQALRGVLAAIPGAPWSEATIEAAPGSLTPDAVRLWRDCGINRVSLGVQSFIQNEIARTGRKHTAEIVARDVELLRESGIDNINIDLIAGLSGQSMASWDESLDWIERLATPHVSVYMFEIDEDSRLGNEILLNGQRYGAPAVPSEELTVELYETAVERLAALGIPRYEISNFARPGWESKHNLKYWHLEPYVGFGADAHSFDGKQRWQNAETVVEYLAHEGPLTEPEPANLDEEKFFVGLRLAEGVAPTAEEWQRYEQPLSRFLREGLLEKHGGAVRLTDRGVLLSNEVFQEFLAK